MIIFCKNYQGTPQVHIPFANRESHKPNTTAKGHKWLERRKASDRFVMRYERSWIVSQK